MLTLAFSPCTAPSVDHSDVWMVKSRNQQTGLKVMLCQKQTWFCKTIYIKIAGKCLHCLSWMNPPPVCSSPPTFASWALHRTVNTKQTGWANFKVRNKKELSERCWLAAIVAQPHKKKDPEALKTVTIQSVFKHPTPWGWYESSACYSLESM